MKLLSWNCNQAFRHKMNRVLPYNADIMVVQESEKQVQIPEPYRNVLWVGDSVHKGISVFVKPHITVENLDPMPEYKWIVPLRLTSDSVELFLFAVWTKLHKDKERSYIGQLYHALMKHEHLLRHDKCIIVGDWNSSKRFDRERQNNHSKVDAFLQSYQIRSAYHSFYGEAQGEETRPTYFLRKELERPFHIDYCYMSTSLITQLDDVSVGAAREWIDVSDHCPILITMKEPEQGVPTKRDTRTTLPPRRVIPASKTVSLKSVEDAHMMLQTIKRNIDDVRHSVLSLGESTSSIQWLYQLKFSKTASDPLFANPENFIELLHQTFTYIVTLESCIDLFRIHEHTDIQLLVNFGNIPGPDIVSNVFLQKGTKVTGLC